jgi:hypothetical protein
MQVLIRRFIEGLICILLLGPELVSAQSQVPSLAPYRYEDFHSLLEKGLTREATEMIDAAIQTSPEDLELWFESVLNDWEFRDKLGLQPLELLDRLFGCCSLCN